MKIRPLPDLDLARIAPLPRDQKRKALDQLKLGHPPYSYSPVRQSALEILNVDVGPLGVVPRASWPKIKEQISKRSRSSDEEEANLKVAEALYGFAEERRLEGRRYDFFPLAIGVSEKITLWLPAVLALDGKAAVPFIDPRRSKKLTADARRFVFSVMHERIRAADPDFAAVDLCIIQFACGDEGVRVPKVHLATDIKLFDFHSLDLMVRETYELWREVLQEREIAIRRKASGTRGPLI